MLLDEFIALLVVVRQPVGQLGDELIAYLRKLQALSCRTGAGRGNKIFTLITRFFSK